MNQNIDQGNLVAVLTAENQRLKQLFNQTRKDKQQAQRAVRKLQAEFKAIQFRLQTNQSEKQRLTGDNRRFMENFETEKKEKIRYLTDCSEATNLVARRDSEITSLKAQNDNLTNQCNRLQAEVENSNAQHIAALKDRQNMINSVRLLQTKLEASEIERQYLKSKTQQFQAQCNRVKQELNSITKKYHEKQIGVEAIYRDQEATKQKLLGQFQRKMSIKDEQMKDQLQKYINENTLLKQKIFQLQGMKV